MAPLFKRLAAVCAVLAASAQLGSSSQAAVTDSDELRAVVARAVRPVMDRYGVPGMAVGVIDRERSAVYQFGVASKRTRAPVTASTLFEIGSISKAFTATLACYAEGMGKLHLGDSASLYLPALRGSAFEHVSLINLGTHTPGGLPLQVPDDVTTDDELVSYLRSWQPSYAPGTYRTYSNLSIGVLGLLSARALGAPFPELVERELFPALGMNRSYLHLPPSAQKDYAEGYSAAGAPIRMHPGVLADEAYGVRTTAGDLVRLVHANMRMLDVDPAWQKAIDATHTGYYRVGTMTQDLIWEQYRYPLALSELLDGNSARMALDANPVTELKPPLDPRADVLINKTGSTNGFSAYIAFVPGRRIGIVILANRNFTIDERVRLGYAILTRLDTPHADSGPLPSVTPAT